MAGYLADGNIGFAMDPDCHYYNSGVRLTVNTSPTSVPEPGTLLFLGTGLLGLAGWKGRRLFR